MLWNFKDKHLLCLEPQSNKFPVQHPKKQRINHIRDSTIIPVFLKKRKLSGERLTKTECIMPGVHASLFKTGIILQSSLKLPW